MPSGRKRGDRGLDFKGEECSSTWRWKKQMFGKQMLAMLCRGDPERTLASTPC